MATEDAGQWFVHRRFRLKFLYAIACLLTRNVCEFSCVDNSLTLNQIYTALKEDVLLVLLYLASDDVLVQIERIRLAALLQFRIFHGRRLSSDFTSGKLSPELSLKFRVSYAAGHWQQEIANTLQLMHAPRQTLIEAGVLERRDGDVVLNDSLHRLRERLCRTFAGQRSRTCALWQGGPYYLAAMFSGDASQRESCLQWALTLFRNLLQYEEKLVSGDCSREFKQFNAGWLLRHSVIFRELLADIAKHKGATANLMALLLKLFQSHYHTKGLEDAFRFGVRHTRVMELVTLCVCADQSMPFVPHTQQLMNDFGEMLWWLRQVYSRSTENGIVSLDRIQWALRIACKRTFPGLYMDDVTLESVANSSCSGRANNLQARVLPKLAQKGSDLLQENFDSRQATFPRYQPRKPHEVEDSGQRISLAHFKHAQQVAYDHIIARLRADAVGRISDWRLVERSFMGGFVNNVHADSAVPSMIIDKARLSLHMITCVLAERLLMALPCRVTSASTIELEPNGKFERIVITDVGPRGAYFSIPVRVTHNAANYNVEYAIDGAAMPILEHACRRALKGVSVATIDIFFKFMGWASQNAADARLGTLIEAFGNEWNMSLTDRARCFQHCHRLTAAALNRAASVAKRLRKKANVDISDCLVAASADAASTCTDEPHPFLGPIRDVLAEEIGIKTKLASISQRVH